MGDASEERSRKRRRLTNEESNSGSSNKFNLPRALANSISPPPLRRNRGLEESKMEAPQALKSPFQLTWIQDLPESSNVDAVSLKDILGDPLIAECWEFNYLHDLEFLMEAFDVDVRGLVKVHIIHGFWKHEDTRRQRLKLQADKYPNIQLHTAYMPEIFGTHHSKMMILIRHDSTAQIIIHTANMIAFDWTNMAQALWRSPLLPIISGDEPAKPDWMGSGSKFKIDLLNYLNAYDTKRTICKPLVEQLSKYDFSEIRAALVASVPGRQGIETDSKTAWGWVGLKNVLSSIPVIGKEPEIVVQISSIATLGTDDRWLQKTLFKALETSDSNGLSKPKFRVIFPTADEIRRSLNGYRSGSAIHVKIQKSAQAKQLQYLKGFLCHWAGDCSQDPSGTSTSVSDSGRKRAAPHVKTYIRFVDSTRASIDWMLLTSSNLSKQAWGEGTNSAGEVRICSYEIGVMVWPKLFGENATIVPTFKTDTPEAGRSGSELVVGARMPYDLPIVPYAKDDVPWCATASYTEPDWLGMAYNVQD